MKKLPIGIQTFCDIVEGDYLYVDKTRFIYDLFADGGKYYFLSRPRRFGKSLLISTMKELFSGRRELFEGLWIYDKIDWQEYPVIHIDFLGLTYESGAALIDTLNYLLDENARFFDIHLKEKTYDKKFKELIEKLSKRNRVVILVDEYDKPIIDFVEDRETAVENRDILRNFYGTIKSSDRFIKFAFMTGVSKFSKVSVFSGLNNLRDITLSEQFAAMLGYTEEELLRYFGPRVEALETKFKKEKARILGDIKRWYNGYSWDGVNFVYNPLSILNFFQEGRFSNYWFSTGTPHFLIKLIKSGGVDIKTIGSWEVDEYVFDSYDIDRLDAASLLFQTGYITIKRIKTLGDNRKYYLSYPNREVKDAFLKYLLADVAATSPGLLGSKIFDLVEHLLAQRLDGFFETLKSLFAGIPYNIFLPDMESYYHTVVFLVLTILGINVKAEVQTNTGRIDAVIEIKDTIYVMEFKMGSETEALAQIKSKEYYQKYIAPGKEVVLVGVGFDGEKRNIGNYILESIPGGGESL
ncbi:MAG: ATP-binding protein [Candidatus Aminicenantes bacterium]|nr:ATP-binding protein [Candidatus Aminicenantes bacterium]